MPVVMREAEVTRFFVREDFNPSSPKQLLQYIKAKNLEPGRNHKTGGETTDKTTLERLAKKDPLMAKVLDWREVKKIDSTYVMPYIDGIVESRIHSSFLHAPSTMRLSSVGPNLQNVPNDEDDQSLAHRFRNCIVASPGCKLVEADFGAIEAVLTGYFMGDPDYMRIARMGMHSFVLADVVGAPAQPDWPDTQLATYLAQIKSKYKSTPQYAACKAGVHMTNYGARPRMMMLQHPKIFRTEREAQSIQDRYLQLCPKLASWQHNLRERAAKEHVLGGNDHPYHYRHWFWDVTAYDPRRGKLPGSDWNNVVAFYPQSTAAGVLFETCLLLTNPTSDYYIGDLYHSKTPLRALIHDSILSEVPIENLSTYINRVRACMTRPIPELQGLSFGVDINVGDDWGSMRKAAYE